jgi:RNA polymerase sigma factor (sigma-70 family)
MGDLSLLFRDEEEYRVLRSKLIVYFERRGCPDANDLADECMTRLWEYATRHGPPKVTAELAMGIARKMILAAFRDRERGHAAVPENFPSTHDSPASERLRLVADDLISRLPPGEREMLEQHYMDRTPWNRIAELLGLSDSGVRVRAKRSRDRLVREFCEALSVKRNAASRADTGEAR